MTVRHVIVGPDRHGVVQHALQIAHACGHEVLRVDTVAGVTPAELAGASVVHVPFTDRLFGGTIEAAVAGWHGLAALVDGAGAALSVTVHDVPHDGSPLQQRRAQGYRQVVGAARGVVVNSQLELAVLDTAARSARSVRMIPLPVVPTVPASGPTERAGRTVGVLGFVYPDRGYEDVLAALPAGCELVAIGAAAAGHDALVGELAACAERLGVGWRSTGYVPDDELGDLLAAVDVPIAPNRRVTASASINTWLAHGRRVLVPDAPYTRELVRSRPHTLQVYDPTVPGDLAAVIRAAFADPASTRLEAGESTLAACAADYADHFRRTAPATPIEVGGGRWTVPGNRWDLLALVSAPDPVPVVSVVVPYFDAQADLDRLLAALTMQTHPHTRFEIVVADDGSPRPPSLAAAGPLTARSVRQDDRGFRAAAARNLGVAAADGDVLAFLDADMVPEPDYLARLCRLPSLTPDCLVVGRRRHARLDGWSPDRVRDWLAGGTPPDELGEPGWLRDGYDRTRDLLDADRRSYRYVISAVLALHRDLVGRTGGFDETFTAYGGEDWELAHRAYVAGAVLAHERGAVAWHNGADWAERTDADARREQKAAETARLAERLPDPQSRGAYRDPARPAVTVELALPLEATAAVLTSAAGLDCAFWHPDAAVVTALAHPLLFAGRPGAQATASANVAVTVDGPADLGRLMDWADDAEQVGEVRVGPVRLISRRLAGRAAHWAVPLAAVAGRHDRSPV